MDLAAGGMDLAAGAMDLAPLTLREDTDLAPLTLREGTDLALLTLGAVMGGTARSQPREEPGDRLPVRGAVADTRARMLLEQSRAELAVQRRDHGRLPAFRCTEQIQGAPRPRQEETVEPLRRSSLSTATGRWQPSNSAREITLGHAA